MIKETQKPQLNIPVVSGSALIAKFLEWKEDFAHRTDRYGVQTIEGYYTPYINNDAHPSNDNQNIFSIEELKFNSDWNWFMDAYKKVKFILEKIDRPSKNHCCKGDSIEVDIHCAVTTINIERGYKHIIEFIEWWNDCGLSLADR